jgi:hypothetical protein
LKQRLWASLLALSSMDMLLLQSSITTQNPVMPYKEQPVGTLIICGESLTTELINTGIQTPGFLNMTLRQPYGVVAAITPWNVPLLFLAGKIAPALIVGNTVVVKSSEKAPLTVRKHVQYPVLH